MNARRLFPPLVAGWFAALACTSTSAVAADDARRGAHALQQYGCGACHRIPGIAGADGTVGPPLDRLGARAYLAGILPNTPDNLARWITSPQRIAPATAMPDMQVTPEDARAMAVWLSRTR